ncbi:hypothetical protein F5B19DRAFT_493167 [Rostrohypoxylon terebratum]|nr:hypothetical protein F5B19DRAFT_493167 [Rostrohypoxylon terebratum]
MANEDTTSTPVPPWDHPLFSKNILSADDSKVATACEEFGELLSICDETCQQVKEQMLTINREVRLNIFEVVIGFSNFDATRYFINTKGGLKTQGLMCLYGYLCPLDCGNILRCLKADAHGYPGAIAVIATAGDETMRMFALAKPVGAHVALRNKACVECCLKFCKENGFEILGL